MDRTENILDDIIQGRWDNLKETRFEELSLVDPSVIERLFVLTFKNLSRLRTFPDFIISYLDFEALPRIAVQALTALRQKPDNRIILEILDNISLQRPTALHPYLTQIFEITGEITSYTSLQTWPWRESGKLHHTFLILLILLDAASNNFGENKIEVKKQIDIDTELLDIRRRASQCLLETSDTRTIVEVIKVINDVAFNSPGLRENLTYLLAEAGYSYKGENDYFVSLNPEFTYHIIFPPAYFLADNRSGPSAPNVHPTCKLSSEPEKDIGESLTHQFGGTTQTACRVCGKLLHHLISLQPVPERLGVTALPGLELAYCLSCLGWEEGADTLWYRHDPAGTPYSTNYKGPQHPPEFPTVGLKPTEVKLVKTPARWRWQDWGNSNGRET